MHLKCLQVPVAFFVVPCKKVIFFLKFVEHQKGVMEKFIAERLLDME